MLTLWDLLKPRKKKAVIVPKVVAPARIAAPSPARAARGRHETMRQKYERATRECLATHGVRVRKWRTSMSGCAWEVYYHDGRISRLIEAPKPTGPMSAAIFLHEIGHHAIGFGRYRPRCLEEYHAWAWSIAEMERRGLNVTDAVRKRMHESLRYAIHKAQRRGLKNLPIELAPFVRPYPH